MFRQSTTSPLVLRFLIHIFKKKLNKKFINQGHKKLRLYKNKNKVIEHDSAKHVQLVYARTSGGGRHAARV